LRFNLIEHCREICNAFFSLKMILPITARPHEGINAGGDCGPCCLAGITGLSVREIYEKYLTRIDGTCYEDIITACWKLRFADKIQYHTTELPVNKKSHDPEYQIFGNPSWENFREWSLHVNDMFLRGYVGIAQVHQNGNAMGDRKHQWYHNHWVLIKGIDGIEEGRKINMDELKVHISCPTFGEYTKEPLEFLMNYGGYNPIWIMLKK
jgi:hypothetical protein